MKAIALISARYFARIDPDGDLQRSIEGMSGLGITRFHNFRPALRSSDSANHLYSFYRTDDRAKLPKSPAIRYAVMLSKDDEDIGIFHGTTSKPLSSSTVSNLVSVDTSFCVARSLS